MFDAATDAISSDLDILGGDQGEDFHFRYDGHVVSQMTGFLRYGTTWSLVTDMDFELAGEPYAIHAEGSIEAQKLTILRQYDAGAARAYARDLAGIES